MSYQGFLKSKSREWTGNGITVGDDGLPSILFPFQQRLVGWALKKGRAALWADTGLGKTFMQVAWASKIPGRVLILAPLCVGHQTVREAAKLGASIGALNSGSTIEITNYEQLHHVDPSLYAGVVLDESSILKSMDGKTRTSLIKVFQGTPYRLCCTATPAPNDESELANHCEFLGIMTRSEMLATFFVHDEDGWRLKGHAHEAFYRWLASWGMFVRRPSDLGFSDEGYILPEIEISSIVVPSEIGPADGMLYPALAGGIKGRLSARRGSIDARVAAAHELIRSTPGQWIAWCGLNPEQDRLADLLGEEAVSVSGAQNPEEKQALLESFIDGRARALVTKPKIAGFGLNLQMCHQMIFVGIGDSYEQYYQAIRRCWRFGQKEKVRVVIILSEAESEVLENVRRKEAEATRTAEALIKHMAEAEKEEIGMTERQRETITRRVEHGRDWTYHNGDSVEIIGEMASESIDMSIYSPPFISLYTYTNSERDIGNCATKEEFLHHFGYVVEGLLRVTKPGRITACHLAQIPSQKAKDGQIGMIDMRGPVIELFTRLGWIYHGDITIDKDPQAQAIRTKSKGLLFTQLKKDSSWLRPALADYILLFRKPGDNPVPIVPDITNEEWIEWARPIWYNIRESNTLNAKQARANEDDRHICPLQLGTIERCIRLWSNKGETVFSPFGGIASEGYEAIRLRRKYIGIELKPEYFNQGVKNLKTIEEVEQSQLYIL